VRLFRVIAASLFALVCLTGCSTTDYRASGYYRRTLSQLDSRPSVAVADKLTAGAARVEITPPVGMPLQGYGARRGEPSTGVHDPLYARVLVVKNSQRQLVLVSCDLMGVTENFTMAILKKAKRQMPLRRRDLIVFATHTHSGAGGLSDRFALQFVGGRFRPRLFEETTDKIAAAIVRAAQHAQPVRVAFARGETENLNKNRAERDRPVDRELGVMRVSGSDGKAVAWFVNFAAHPTVLGMNWEFSADYPGCIARQLERDGAVALFANGAAGDLNIQGQRNLSREAKAERVGTTLAHAAIGLISGASSEELAILDVRRVEVELPPVRIRAGRCTIPSWIGDCVFPRHAPVQLARVGRALLLAVPLEVNAEVGLAWKREAAKRGYELFLIGYANDYIGYIVPEKTYRTDDYEARTSFYGAQFDSYLTEVVVRMMEMMAE
jgi:hypothetical protein